MSYAEIIYLFQNIAKIYQCCVIFCVLITLIASCVFKTKVYNYALASQDCSMSDFITLDQNVILLSEVN